MKPATGPQGAAHWSMNAGKVGIEWDWSQRLEAQSGRHGVQGQGHFGYKALWGGGWAREQTKPKTPKWDYVQKGRTPWVYVVTRDQQLKGKCVPGNLGGGSVSSYTVC